MTSATETNPSDKLVGEHRLQLDMLNAIARVLDEGGDPADIDPLLERLSEYTEIHFASEQMLMRLYAYPAYEAHVDEHDRTLNWLDTLRATWRGRDQALMKETLNELRQWVEGHIRRADRAFEGYLDTLQR